VARRIIDAHGGQISVEDAPGRGARFVVRLDLANGAQP
jgi:signal transduction histidine kinase